VGRPTFTTTATWGTTGLVRRIHHVSSLPCEHAIQDGRLVEIRIYPVDLGLGEPRRPLSRANVPLTPSPKKAREILEKLQKYSEPFGTKISIENNIGIIRVPPEATVEIGGDLAIPGRGKTPSR